MISVLIGMFVATMIVRSIAVDPDLKWAIGSTRVTEPKTSSPSNSPNVPSFQHALAGDKESIRGKGRRLPSTQFMQTKETNRTPAPLLLTLDHRETDLFFQERIRIKRRKIMPGANTSTELIQSDKVAAPNRAGTFYPSSKRLQ